MPELPDITIYIEALERRIVGQPLDRRTRSSTPFVLRSVDPPLDAVVGAVVAACARLGKRIVIDAGRRALARHPPHDRRPAALEAAGRASVPASIALAAFEFPTGTLVLTEAGTKRRASLHLVRGEEALAQFDRGGLEVLDADARAFAERLARENHTLKRSLTDPRLFSGIGNAYSDEILHRARLSPLALTQKLSDEEIARLFDATRSDARSNGPTRLRAEAGDGFPEKVTAFRDGDGRPRPLRPALPRLRHARAAHRLRRQRDQLLPALPDGGPDARRPCAVAAAEGGLAEDDRRGGRRECRTCHPARASESRDLHFSDAPYWRTLNDGTRISSGASVTRTNSDTNAKRPRKRMPPEAVPHSLILASYCPAGTATPTAALDASAGTTSIAPYLWFPPQRRRASRES